MALGYSTGVADRLLGKSGSDVGADGLRGIFANCVVDLYSGTRPLSADDSIGASTLLGRVTLDAGAFVEGVSTNGLNFASPASGVLSKEAAENWKYEGLTTGTIRWFRLRGNAVDDGLSSTVLPRIDGTVGSVSGDMIASLLNVTLNAPGTIDIFNIKRKT